MLYAGAERQMLEVRDVIRRPEPPATAEFATLPARVIKIVSSLALAHARVIETASWVRLAVAAGHFVAVLFTSLMSGARVGRAVTNGACGMEPPDLVNLQRPQCLSLIAARQCHPDTELPIPGGTGADAVSGRGGDAA